VVLQLPATERSNEIQPVKGFSVNMPVWPGVPNATTFEAVAVVGFVRVKGIGGLLENPESVTMLVSGVKVTLSSGSLQSPDPV
jgi:hypothetical protein